ncbi:MAG TPA: TonB-dependent receptor, partial [Candidatus Sulfopaludibacter sp.]|nr:TonB-dependent receptor [Candidatus Sulfopaludibacter sp.]
MLKRFSVPISVLALTFAASAQVDRPLLSGTVTDATGSAMPGVKVEAAAAATNFQRQALTGATGTYQIPGLPIGSYTITFSKPGFRDVDVKGVELAVGQPRTVDTQMQVGTLTEAVTVTAALETLNRSTAEVGGLVEPEQIREIPISGRNWASLMLLAPGAVNYGDGAQRAIRFSGHSLDDSNFAFDGIDTSGVQEQTQKADTRLNIALDSIAEFRVSTAVYTAETGAAGGAQINVVSKSGGNDYHGSAFYALRNDALDARSPFDGSTLPPFTLHQFGASIGGAIVKDKAFFYANYEGLRQSLGETLINFVPNAAFRQQVLATSPALKPIIDAYPLGQTPIDSVTDQITKVATDTVREDAGMFRFDYRFTDNTTAYARYNVDNAYIDTPTDALGSHNVIPHVPTNFVMALQHIFTPTTIDEVKVGLNRANYHNWGYGTAPVAVSVASFDGVSDTSLDTEVGTTFSYINNLTLVRGRHTFKTGIDIRRIRLNNSGNTLTTSSVSYATADDFIHNRAQSATYLEGEGVVGNRRTFAMGYFQDDFKVTRDLTLNLGLRYEYYSVTHEILNRSAVVDIAGCGGFCPKGTPYYNPNPTDLGPRVGLAWAPGFLHGKTTVRTGFGIYYGGNQNDDFSDAAESAVPRYSLAVTDFPALSFPLVAFLDPKNQLFSPKAIARNRKDLSYNNWDFVVQHELPREFLLQVGYVGSEGHHLFDKYTVNLINPATGKRTLATFGSFGLKANDGNNNFNALQASIQRRFKHGLLFQANYMYSHGIADASIGSGEGLTFQDMGCRACDRSSTNIDVRHNLTANGVYELPFRGTGTAKKILGGWEVAALASARTGLPVNITISRKAAALPDGNTSSQRPNAVPGISIYAANQTINNWFNPLAFATPASGTWGNLGRYIGNGPDHYEIDSSLQKRFRLTERTSLNFRASAFNLTNHPQYASPSGNASSSSFGRITSVLNTGATGSGAP